MFAAAADADAPHLGCYTKEGGFFGDEALECGYEGSKDFGARVLGIVAGPNVSHKFSIGA